MAAPPQPLCDFCQNKPKFGKHKYCGKTCSQQAAALKNTSAPAYSQPQIGSTLCKQCNQRPKFGNFDFCGKNCASAWQVLQGGPNGSSNPPAKKSGGNILGQMSANAQIPNQLLGQIPQPLQAQLQAALPALAAAFQQPGNNPPQQQQPPASVNLSVNNVSSVPPSSTSQQPTVATSLTSNTPNQNPPQQKASVNQNVNGGTGSGLPPPQNAQGAAQGVNSAAVPTQLPTAITSSTCRLTGCTKPVYTDPASNHASEYCSKRHREDAVITGQVKACIMCLKMPRSSADHFCSKACKDAALSQ